MYHVENRVCLGIIMIIYGEYKIYISEKKAQAETGTTCKHRRRNAIIFLYRYVQNTSIHIRIELNINININMRLSSHSLHENIAMQTNQMLINCLDAVVS